MEIKQLLDQNNNIHNMSVHDIVQHLKKRMEPLPRSPNFVHFMDDLIEYTTLGIPIVAELWFFVDTSAKVMALMQQLQKIQSHLARDMEEVPSEVMEALDRTAETNKKLEAAYRGMSSEMIERLDYFKGITDSLKSNHG